MRLLTNCGAARTKIASVNAAPIMPPTIAGSSGDPLLSFTIALLVLLQLGPRHHGDVLCPKIVRTAGWDPAHGHFGACQRELGVALEIVALGSGKRGARRVAFLVVDHPQLVPGEGVLIVGRNGSLQDGLGLCVILL